MKPHKRHLRLMLAGWGAGLLIVFSVVAYSARLASEIDKYGDACTRAKWAGVFAPLVPEENRDAYLADAGMLPDDESEQDLQAELGEIVNPWNEHKWVCDPLDVQRLITQDPSLREFRPPGFQGDLWEAVHKERELDSARKPLYFLAAGISGVLSLPFLWYFLLARLKELLSILFRRE